MLEQRTESNIRTWGFLLTEMVLIVASILFAFALDSWWDQRRQGAEEHEILLGLQEEFQLNQAKLQRRIEQHEQNLLNVEELLAAAMRGGWTAADLSVDEALASLIAPPTTDMGNGVLAALISGGRIEMLSNKDLRGRLAAWEGVISEVQDDELLGRKLVFDTVLPYLIRHGVPVSGPMSTWPDNWSGPSRSVSDDPQALSRLLGDSQFSVILEARLGYNLHARGEYEHARNEIEAILSAVGTSLKTD